jgi:acid phosphatase class B
LLKTGRGAAGKTMVETRRLFRQAKQFAVPKEASTFLVDFHDAKGDLIVMIDGRGYRALTGEKPLTLAEARRTDSAYWAKAREVRGWTK